MVDSLLVEIFTLFLVRFDRVREPLWLRVLELLVLRGELRHDC